MFGKRLVFSGGMCNFIGADGVNRRNPARDDLNAKLRARGHSVFDPQIDEVSHGRAYNYDIDGPAEQAARAKADVLIYQIGQETQAGVTMLEIMRDAGAGRKVIVWLTGDVDAKGRPVFKPEGMNVDSIDDAATKAHAAQAVKQGSSMRANLIDFLRDAKSVRFVRTEDELEAALRDYKIRI